MDLILWRHAQAQELEGLANAGPDYAAADLARPLTAQGLQQAELMAQWLLRHLKGNTQILSSPALRCKQTVLALGRQYSLHEELSPDKEVEDLLSLVRWPLSEQPVLVVGHQPVLSQVVMRLLGCPAQEGAFRKGAVWWLHSRQRNGRLQTVVATVQSPGFM